MKRHVRPVPLVLALTLLVLLIFFIVDEQWVLVAITLVLFVYAALVAAGVLRAMAKIGPITLDTWWEKSNRQSGDDEEE